MEKFKKIKIKSKIVDDIFKDMKKNYKDIMEDYKKKFNKKEIEKSFLKQRLLARFLTFRTLDDKNFKPLLNAIEKKINKKIFLAPLYYIRICPPNLMYGKNHKKTYLYTEPHYDSFDFSKKSYGVWVPLRDTTVKTGTLSYIKKTNRIKKLFPNKGKNRFNIKNYLKEFQKVDDILKNNNVPVHCKVGDVLIFNRKTLHGATHPLKEARLSLNFQITFEKKSKVLNKKKFFYTNNNLIEKNMINLKYMGDEKFFYKNKKLYYEKFGKLNDKEIINLYKKIKLKRINVKSIREDVHWTKEDSWIENSI